MKKMVSRKVIRSKRTARIRAIIRGTADRPRLSLYKSNTSLYVQIIDDAKKLTVFSFRSDKNNVAAAKDVGQKVAEEAKKKHITHLVFDRGGYRYHGVVKTLADTVREGGITI